MSWTTAAEHRKPTTRPTASNPGRTAAMATALPWLFLATALVVALAPLALLTFPASYDGMEHVFRVFALEDSFRRGVLYPRWSDNLYLEMGYPLFGLYSPLSYYAAEAFRLLGLGVFAATRATMALCLALGALGTALLGRRWAGATGGAAAGAVFLLSPYVLADAYVRFDLAESAALAALPFALLGLDGLVGRPEEAPGQTRRAGALALTAGALAAIVWLHTVVAVAAAPLIAAVATALIARRARAKDGWRAIVPALARAGLAGALAAGLSAAFWLPALAWQGEVRLGEFAVDALFFTKLLDLPGLVRAFPDWGPPFEWPFAWWGPAGRLWAPQVREETGLGYLPVGPAYLTLALAAAGGLAAWWRDRRSRALVTALAAGAFAPAILMTSLSAPLWLLAGRLTHIQFPWRLVGPLCLALALLIGLGAPRPRRAAAWTLALLAPLLFLPPWLALRVEPLVVADEEVSLPALLRREIAGRGGTTNAGQFLPRTVKDTPVGLPEAMPAPASPADLRITSFAAGPTILALTYTAREDTSLRLLRFDFPGWQATVDGHETPVGADGPTGLLRVTLPAGAHRLDLRFERAPLETAGWAVTLACALGLGGWAIRPGWSRARTAAAAALGTICLGAAVAAWLNAPGAAAFAITSPAGSPALLAWRRDGDELRLAWLGDGRAADEVVRVRLLDSTGAIAAEETARPRRGGTQTDRWPAGLLVEDRVPLRLPPGCGGSFDLEVALADAAAPGVPTTRWDLGAQAFPGRPCAPLPPIGDGEPEIALGRFAVAGAGPGRIPALAPGGRLAVELEYAVRRPVFEDYVLYTELRDARSRPVAKANGYGADDLALTAAWPIGRSYRYVARLALPAELPPGRYTLVAGLFSSARTARIPIFWADAAVEEARLAELRVAPRPAPAGGGAVPGGPRLFNGMAALEAVSLPPAARAGEAVPIGLWWRGHTPMARDYAAYLHLSGPDDRPLAQADGPAGGAYPTGLWEPGERVYEERPLELPRDLPAGTYRVLAGLYDPATGARLAVEGPDGPVGTIEVRR